MWCLASSDVCYVVAFDDALVFGSFIWGDCFGGGFVMCEFACCAGF